MLHSRDARIAIISPAFLASCVFNAAWICTYVQATAAANQVSAVFLISIFGSLYALVVKGKAWHFYEGVLCDSEVSIWIHFVTKSGWSSLWCSSFMKNGSKSAVNGRMSWAERGAKIVPGLHLRP